MSKDEGRSDGAGAGANELEFRMPSRRRLDPGQVISGTVVMVGSSHVFLDVGSKSEAALAIEEVRNDKGEVLVKVGDTLEAYVVATEPEITLSYGMARAHLNLEAIQDAHDLGVPVEGKVAAVNKGGLEVDLNGVRAFCPVSQIELGYCEQPAAYVGQKLQFRIQEFAEGGKNIVVSRRALLEEEREQAAEETRAMLQEGAEFAGTVVSVQPYGAFVEFGGMQGMVHISEVCHQRIEHPNEMLQVGQSVRVKVIRIEPDPKNSDRQRIALSMRALEENPWDVAAATLTEGQQVEGKVVRLQPFGAFVEIAPGVDGLVHVSQLAERRVAHPSEVVAVGDKVQATVLKLDRSARRISLSLLGQDLLDSEDLGVGALVDTLVDRIKPFGLLVTIKGYGRNVRGLIPVEEIPPAKTSNLRRTFPEGTEVKALVISIDPANGRLRLSLTQVNEQEERQEYNKFVKAGQPPAAEQRKSAGRPVGSFGEALLKALNTKKEGGGN